MKNQSKLLEVAKSMVKWEQGYDHRTEVNGGMCKDGILRCSTITSVGNDRLSPKQKSFIISLMTKEKSYKTTNYGLEAWVCGYYIEMKDGGLTINLNKSFEGHEASSLLKKYGHIK